MKIDAYRAEDLFRDLADYRVVIESVMAVADLPNEYVSVDIEAVRIPWGREPELPCTMLWLEDVERLEYSSRPVVASVDGIGCLDAREAFDIRIKAEAFDHILRAGEVLWLGLRGAR